jgi:hypothetical protein
MILAAQAVAADQGDQMSIFRRPKCCPNIVFVKINTQLILWKKYPKM